MKFITVLFGTTIASIVLFFNIATAGETPDMATIDTDQNGMVNSEEAAQVPDLANIFAGADLDQDGQLSSDEYDRAKRHLDSKDTEEAE
ncbi:MAG: hypothetical protein AB8B92_05405 [Gammaproteobacteria bacterium]